MPLAVVMRPSYALAIVLALTSLLFGSCTHTVEYPLTVHDKVTRQKISRVVEVKKFEDKVPLRRDAVVDIDGEPWRTNPIRGYTGQDVAASVSPMIAQHLDHSGLFKKVIYRGADRAAATTHAREAQLILDGKITKYTVMGRINQPAEMKSTASSFFGLTGRVAGLIANLGENTEIRVTVELSDVKLKDARTGRVLWTDSVVVTKKYKADYEAAHARAVYDEADACLKQAVSELIRRMSKKVRS
jgi:hypothetical protein